MFILSMFIFYLYIARLYSVTVILLTYSLPSDIFILNKPFRGDMQKYFVYLFFLSNVRRFMTWTKISEISFAFSKRT
jgi:hypothetical protein